MDVSLGSGPVYLLIIDEQGNEVASHCRVTGRENRIEAYQLDYGVAMRADERTGITTGTRQHKPLVITKALDATSPILFDAACTGKTFQQVSINYYGINREGKEINYFTDTLNNVKVVDLQSGVLAVQAKAVHAHFEKIAFRFEEIIRAYHDGNIIASDKWTERG